MTENVPIVLDARSVSCSRAPDGGPLAPVRNLSLSIHAGSVNILAGGGNDGEGLLLRLLGLLDAPDEGEIFFHGEATRGLPEEVRAELRNRCFGFVFAEPFLLPAFSVVENVAMPLFKIFDVDADEARMRTQAMLEFTGMAGCSHWAVGQLTLAQQRRVSLARALVNQPEVLVVENAGAGLAGGELSEFVELIRGACADFGATAILTARDAEALKSSGRVVELVDGAIVHDSLAVVEKGAA